MKDFLKFILFLGCIIAVAYAFEYDTGSGIVLGILCYVLLFGGDSYFHHDS